MKKLLSRLEFLKVVGCAIPTMLLIRPEIKQPTITKDEVDELLKQIWAEAPKATIIHDPTKESEAQVASGYPVEIQIEDTQFFRPDGWYGALYDVESKQMHMHYVLNGVNYNEIWKHGIWTTGESGLARVVVSNL